MTSLKAALIAVTVLACVHPAVAEDIGRHCAGSDFVCASIVGPTADSTCRSLAYRAGFARSARVRLWERVHHASYGSIDLARRLLDEPAPPVRSVLVVR
jgi:hypothetical protein